MLEVTVFPEKKTDVSANSAPGTLKRSSKGKQEIQGMPQSKEATHPSTKRNKSIKYGLGKHV